MSSPVIGGTSLHWSVPVNKPNALTFDEFVNLLVLTFETEGVPKVTHEPKPILRTVFKKVFEPNVPIKASG